jgi:hypothetical protein
VEFRLFCDEGTSYRLSPAVVDRIDTTTFTSEISVSASTATPRRREQSYILKDIRHSSSISGCHQGF